MVTNTGTIRNYNKMIYFIIGGQGMGKSTLALYLKQKLMKYKNMLERDVIIYDDIGYALDERSKRKMSESITSVRHLNQNVIIISHDAPPLKFSFIENKFVTWVITDLINIQVSNYLLYFKPAILSKFRNQLERYFLGKRKSKPYLLITLDKHHKTHFEFHKFKKQKELN